MPQVRTMHDKPGCDQSKPRVSQNSCLGKTNVSIVWYHSMTSCFLQLWQLLTLFSYMPQPVCCDLRVWPLVTLAIHVYNSSMPQCIACSHLPLNVLYLADFLRIHGHSCASCMYICLGICAMNCEAHFWNSYKMQQSRIVQCIYYNAWVINSYVLTDSICAMGENGLEWHKWLHRSYLYNNA